ncbi:uncharacterized protein CC84DRAFT_1117139 [Paraphaeosphaeria sporulosa]|uniref:Glycoside hydrolase n=1 Tax=Paraphaeosphaeria sporulosa TaxID=1460663 RepID=A0A177CJM2_9PLEO|nr:uncharacterized protein CC84DRAFT_1117139 [Paraphaeosphaeria sporulosa]OAG07068.1 hypothetical protein CC84DRAFT_1117139 [Paraphaeosphaeria sporulosa]
MRFPGALGSLLSLAGLTSVALADLRIAADNHSFGGVNFPQLQFLEPSYREEVIRAIVKTNARVIRLFIRGDEHHGDPEPEVGEFDRALLNQFDDTLAAIHRISEGKTKVIIAPHDAHALRGSNNVPCDGYCKKLDGAFLDFYSQEEYRTYYKTRLEVFFRHYASKNFGGRPWSELSEVILGVDVQNEPWSGIWPIPAGEAWLCDIATHLKDVIGLGDNNIAVITGGISGPQTVDGIQNTPDSAWNCPAVDVIGIHGYFAQGEEETAGTPWTKMFLPGNTLTGRATDKKLLLVEEWSYMNTDLGLNYKKQAIFDQGNALNYRGIPWIYSHLTFKDEGTSPKISITRESNYAIGALSDVLTRASRSRSNFNWSKYLPAPSGGLSNLTTLPLNLYIPEQASCTFGCEGHLCDAADGCRPSLICKNSICQQPSDSQPGKIGDACNSKKPCLSHLKCASGSCQTCNARATIQPWDRRPDNSYNSHNPFRRDPIAANSPAAQCHPDTANAFLVPPRPICSSPASRENPCTNAQHCNADQYCDWGLCKACTEGCLGMKCRSNNKCKTGFCNTHGRCDYAGQKKVLAGPGGQGRSTTRNRKGAGYNLGAPKGQGSGPNKVWDVPMKVNIPKEEVVATGAATA